MDIPLHQLTTATGIRSWDKYFLPILKVLFYLRMQPKIRHLYALNKSRENSEQINILLQTPHLRLEQIASYGTPSAAGFWYDQEETEWVLLAKGQAVLEFEGKKLVKLSAGDYLEIPAHERHRVESCSQDAVWLALHY